MKKYKSIFDCSDDFIKFRIAMYFLFGIAVFGLMVFLSFQDIRFITIKDVILFLIAEGVIIMAINNDRKELKRRKQMRKKGSIFLMKM
ncbi:Ca2+/Na+ antiporter [Ereboglobus sp. PH5-5]|nr:Ca2+/Na+ antiporter [Ereboglobus sp. PH5-10]MDF9831998.1 Ca2+/Na+ antiporter [Ereboglobus sp. PH5-5]